MHVSEYCCKIIGTNLILILLLLLAKNAGKLSLIPAEKNQKNQKNRGLRFLQSKLN
jgi:hypothetical protein